MKLNKDKWIKVDFKNIVICVDHHSKNPIAEGYNKYVGLENINGETLKIEGYGNVTDGTTFSKVFTEGDVLFGKRRAYLKKVAIADFNGICSSDILVFRPKVEFLNAKLLPFYVLSNDFINYAVKTSSGSLSPRTRWKDLANYEILLPPLEEQKQIVALFQSIETAIEAVEGQERKVKDLSKKLIDGLVNDKPTFGKMFERKNINLVNYGEVTEKIMRKIDPVKYGIERIVAGEHMETDDLKIRNWGILGKYCLGPAFHVLFTPGDILYGSRRTYLRKVALADFEGVCANTTYVIRAKEEILLQNYLKHIMLSDRFTQYSISVSKGSTNPYINWKDLDNFSLYLPDISTQKEIVDVLDRILDIIEQLKQQKTTLKNLKQKLLSDILG